MATPNLNQQPSPSSSSAQLTIFFNGIVKVFDDITPEKAKAIMLFASSGNSSAQFGSTQLAKPRLLAGGDKLQRIVNVGQLPMRRKLALQRFLEKRKQRLLSRSPYRAPDEMCPTENSS